MEERNKRADPDCNYRYTCGYIELEEVGSEKKNFPPPRPS
jgi:hypothetical protein